MMARVRTWEARQTGSGPMLSCVILSLSLAMALSLYIIPADQSAKPHGQMNRNIQFCSPLLTGKEEKNRCQNKGTKHTRNRNSPISAPGLEAEVYSAITLLRPWQNTGAIHGFRLKPAVSLEQRTVPQQSVKTHWTPLLCPSTPFNYFRHPHGWE